MEEENIYPIFDRMLSRKDKEELLGQRGVMLSRKKMQNRQMKRKPKRSQNRRMRLKPKKLQSRWMKLRSKRL